MMSQLLGIILGIRVGKRAKSYFVETPPPKRTDGKILHYISLVLTEDIAVPYT